MCRRLCDGFIKILRFARSLTEVSTNMKTKTFIQHGAALLGLAIASLNAQSQTTYVQTTKIIGKTVKTENGEEVGVIKDVVIDESSGCLAYTVVSTGGTGTRITGQAKLVAVPWTLYSIGPDVSVVT